jgi:hypothetical protein
VWSLSIWKFFLRAWLSSFFYLSLFFHGPSCVQLFFSLFLYAWTFMCPLFFLMAHVSFVTKDGEKDHNHIMWSFYFVGSKEWYNANFSWKHSKGGIWCAWESWSCKHEKNSSEGHNNLTMLNVKTSSISVGFSR